MFVFLAIYLCLVSTSTTADEFSEANKILKNLLKIEVDDKCVENKIGFYFFEKLAKNLELCTIDVYQLISSTTSFGTEEDVISKLCQSNSIKYCTPIVLQSLKLCLNDDQNNYLKYKIASDDAIKNYACANNAKALKGFFNMDKRSCSNEDILQQSTKCREISLPLGDIRIEDMFEEDSCLLIDKSVTCLADTFRSCKDKAMYRFIKESGHAGLRATPCGAYISGSNSLSGYNLSLIALYVVCVYVQNVIF